MNTPAPPIFNPARDAESGRSMLPVARHEMEIVDNVRRCQVTLISGAPGCGKTTQVPQYLLDHFVRETHEPIRIAVSQPRRISAITVAQRVAWERSEELGTSVGYQIR